MSDTSAAPTAARVSVHGGHSGEFCSHAHDTLEEVLEEYQRQGFAWVGITEHMPPPSDELVPPEERAAGLDARDVLERFRHYADTAKRLQRRFAPHLRVLVAFEAETCTGSDLLAERLIDEIEPDYVVGSVHHVRDIPIDSSSDDYAEAIKTAGGIEALYAAYFDDQYELIRRLRPSVVGHFDLIRLLDADYTTTLQHPDIVSRIERNLQAVRDIGAILDYNVRALAKGQAEPYVSQPILERAATLGLRIAPGDDSHGVAGVGVGLDEGIRLLRSAGFRSDWPVPG